MSVLTDPDYIAALDVDDGLALEDYKDKRYLKCVPQANADAYIAESGTPNSIGVTASYKIITAPLSYPDVDSYDDCTKDDPECTDSVCLQRTLKSVTDVDLEEY